MAFTYRVDESGTSQQPDDGDRYYIESFESHPIITRPPFDSAVTLSDSSPALPADDVPSYAAANRSTKSTY